jgi:RNA polymerase sigma-70 factor (ECF subfamily)
VGLRRQLDFHAAVEAAGPTVWTVIRAAATGSPADRNELARRYVGVVRACLAARWRGSRLRDYLHDATREVLVDCIRTGGVLKAIENGRVRNFRAFLYNAIRTVARRFESRPARPALPLPKTPADEESLPKLFERSWARALMSEAAQHQRRQASGPRSAAVRRVELLRLRFQEHLPLRDIAERWGVRAATLHHEYARARQEFRAALLEVVAFHHPGSPAEVEQEAASLLQALS